MNEIEMAVGVGDVPLVQITQLKAGERKDLFQV